MGKLTDKLDKINEKLRKETLKADAKIEAAEGAVAQTKAEAAAKVEDAKKVVAGAKAQVEGRKNAIADKIQGNIQDCKDKIAAKCEAKDKENWKAYIAALLEYAEDCEDASFLFDAEAALAIAMAELEVCDYIDTYGDDL